MVKIFSADTFVTESDRWKEISKLSGIAFTNDENDSFQHILTNYDRQLDISKRLSKLKGISTINYDLLDKVKLNQHLDAIGLRTLKIIHPNNEWDVVDFLAANGPFICKPRTGASGSSGKWSYQYKIYRSAEEFFNDIAENPNFWTQQICNNKFDQVFLQEVVEVNGVPGDTSVFWVPGYIGDSGEPVYDGMKRAFMPANSTYHALTGHPKDCTQRTGRYDCYALRNAGDYTDQCGFLADLTKLFKSAGITNTFFTAQAIVDEATQECYICDISFRMNSSLLKNSSVNLAVDHLKFVFGLQSELTMRDVQWWSCNTYDMPTSGWVEEIDDMAASLGMYAGSTMMRGYTKGLYLGTASTELEAVANVDKFRKYLKFLG